MVTRVYGLGPSCVPNVARAKYPKLADGGHERGGLAAMPALDCQEKGVSSVFIQRGNCIGAPTESLLVPRYQFVAESYGARSALDMSFGSDKNYDKDGLH